MSDLVTATAKQQVGRKATKARVEDLVHDGDTDIVRFRGVGRGDEYMTLAARPNLLWLYNHAMKYAYDDSVHNRRGRPRADEPRRVNSVNDKDAERIRSALTHIGRFLAQRNGIPRSTISDEEAWRALEQVDGHYLSWNPVGGDQSAGKWSAALELLDAATRDDICEGSLKRSTLAGMRSGLAKLLDLGASRGWLPSTDRHHDDYCPVHPEWQEIYQIWTDVLKENTRFRHGRDVLVLLEAVSECGWPQPEDAEWEQVLTCVERRFANDTTFTSERKAQVRRTYRVLRQEGLIDGPPWNVRGGVRNEGLIILSTSAIKEIAEHYAWDGPRGTGGWNWRTWEWPDAAQVGGLIDGDYGLRVALRAMTVTGASRAAHPDVPDRSRYPREPVRTLSSRSSTPWSSETVRANLERILFLAGWMATYCDVDWRHADLRSLLNRGYWETWIEWASRESTQGRIARLAETNARLASPLVEAMALKRGDQRTADEAHEVSRWLSHEVRPAAVEGAVIDSVDDEEDLETAQAESRRTEEAWTAGTGLQFSYEQLTRITRAAVTAFSTQWGELEDQLDRVECGKYLNDAEWAFEVQRLFWWMSQLLVPLRPETLRRSDVGHVKLTSDTVRAVYPKVAMKSKRAFRPWYSSLSDKDDGTKSRICETKDDAKDVDTQWDQEEEWNYGDIHHRLACLYLCPGGALSIILGRDPKRVDPLWPTRAGRRYQESSSFCSWMQDMVKRFDYAIKGPVTFASLKASGVLTTQKFRHSFAKPLVYLGKASRAAMLLGHADTTMVERVYGATDESDIQASEVIRM